MSSLSDTMVYHTRIDTEKERGYLTVKVFG